MSMYQIAQNSFRCFVQYIPLWIWAFERIKSMSICSFMHSFVSFSELECLYWGLYFNSSAMVASHKGIHLLTQKWSQTLRELDLTNQTFSEEDMEIAIGHLAYSPGAISFRSLNLSGTKITTSALRYKNHYNNQTSYVEQNDSTQVLLQHTAWFIKKNCFVNVLFTLVLIIINLLLKNDKGFYLG